MCAQAHEDVAQFWGSEEIDNVERLSGAGQDRPGRDCIGGLLGERQGLQDGGKKESNKSPQGRFFFQ